MDPEVTQNQTTPSAEPAAPAQPPAAPENGGDLESRFIEPDYGVLADEIVRSEAIDEESPQGETPPSAPTPEQAAAPQATPPAAPSPSVPAQPSPAAEAQPPAPAVPAPAANAQPPAPQPPAQPQIDPAELEKAVTEALMKRLALSPEEAAQVDDVAARPSEYLPKLLAKVYKDVFEQTLAVVQSQTPAQVAATLAQDRAAREAEEAFFSRWPDLKGRDDDVVQAIKAVRIVEPNIDPKRLIEKAGALAMLNVGVAPPQVPASNPTAPASSPAPLPPPRPLQPGAGSTASSLAPRPTYEEQVYAEMVQQEYGQ